MKDFLQDRDRLKGLVVRNPEKGKTANKEE
jgi:hypothetical protein